MQISMSGNTATFARAAVCAFASALVLSACASSGSSHKPARIEIQEQLGFTITEKARISANVRLDYNEALSLLDQDRIDEGIALLELVAAAAPQLSARNQIRT